MQQSATRGKAQRLTLSAMLGPPGLDLTEPAREEQAPRHDPLSPMYLEPSAATPPGLVTEPSPALSAQEELDKLVHLAGNNKEMLASLEKVAKCLPKRLPLAEKGPVLPPPGLEHLQSQDKPDARPPLGLSLAKCIGTDSDETSAGSGAASHSSDSDVELPLPARSVGLVLADVSQLKATAPMFRPMLSPNTASVLPSVEKRTPLRAKLRSKADAFVPAGVEMFGMSAVKDAEPFVPGACAYSQGELDAPWDDVANSSTIDGFSSRGLSSQGSNEYYSQQDWYEEWNEEWQEEW